MSYLVLARKWRPQSFDDIAGQEHITRTLRNAIRANRIAHAYLFTGVRGVGKTTAARILAKALNCEKGPTPNPCNNCSHCNEITSGNSLDVLEIDGASNRGIDEIRQIIENVRYQPARCRFKIYVIDEVHQVTKDAFNALLKTLEEPPPSVKFILATTEPHRLPDTILSRCQRYDFRRIPLREIVQRLGEISKEEGLEISQPALALVAREADGSMRDAQSLLEQVLACAMPGDDADKTSIDEESLQEMLGLTERRILYELSNAAIQGNAQRCIELIAKVVIEGADLSRLSRDLVEHFRNLLVVRLSEPRGQSTAGKGQLLDLPDQEIEDLRAQAAGISVDTLLDYFDFMAAGDEEVGRSPNPRFVLETIMVRLATLPQTVSIPLLLERLEKLERRLPAASRSVSAPAQEGTEPISQPAVPASPAVAPLAGDKDGVWQNFVAFVGKEKKFLASHLQAGTVIELPPAQLTVGVIERHHLNYLQDPDNLTALKGFAKRFFGDDVAIVITGMEPEGTGRKSESIGSGAGNSEGEGSSMVKEALRIFGGSIKTARRENG